MASAGWAASVLSWWQEAGVDTIVGETPRDWLNPQASPTSQPAARAATAPALPDRLADFQAWLVDGDDPALGPPTAPRVGPAGNPAAGLMVLVGMPSAEDVASGRLLSGEAGALFDRMMAAIGRGRDTLYLAALSPSRTPSGSLDPAAAEALATIARHHVGLVRPKALLLFGDTCSKALLGDGVLAARAKWHGLATPAGTVRTLATIKPETLLEKVARKKHAWADLQMLREELES